MANKEKCFICGRDGEHEFNITIDNGGKLRENIETEQTYVCIMHWKEFQALQKKKRPKDDFR